MAALLSGNNTTISIAHRLSTIKRSDTIIVLGPDGRVAEQGSYEQLSSRPDGAFTKLMEWQMSGGETTSPSGKPTEADEPWKLQTESEPDLEEDDVEEVEEKASSKKE